VTGETLQWSELSQQQHQAGKPGKITGDFKGCGCYDNAMCIVFGGFRAISKTKRWSRKTRGESSREPLEAIE
jgi:hypothetical protein